MPTRLIALFLGLLAAVTVAQNTKYQAGGAGEVAIKYGTPQWREDRMKQVEPGTFWRLGAGGATTIETSAAIVTKEGVVFPGTYNLNARIGGDEWALLFHKEGTFYKEGAPRVALFALQKGDLTDKKMIADRLQIDLEGSKDKALQKAGGALFRIRFGPHSLESSWRILGVTKKHLALGSVQFNLETVKLPAVEEFLPVIEGKAAAPFTFARLTLDNDKGMTACALVPGEEPLLKLVDFSREVKGTRTTASSTTATLKVVLESEHLKLHLGSTLVDFPLAASVLSKAESGGTTPKGGK